MSIDWNGAEATVAAAIRARGVESDLTDAALVGYANAARQEIGVRVGATDAIVRRSDGGVRYIFVHPPIGTLDTVTEAGTTLVEDTDFRVGTDGTYIERLDGTYGHPRRFGPSVEISYDFGIGDDRYDRVVIDLIKLALEYSGLDSRRDGDYAEEGAGARGGGLNGYQQQRDQIISELTTGGVIFA